VRRIIVNADDFGYNADVVRGIVKLHQAGVVSSVSCMTNMPAWPQAAAYLREQPGLGAGVHLVFSEGYPLLPSEQVPALVGKDGQFLNNNRILTSLRRGMKNQLRAEFSAQVERFVRDVGRSPDHLDNHSAISYARPGSFRVSLDLAQEYGLPIRFPIGDDLEERAAEMGRVWSFSTWPIRWLGARFRCRVDRSGLRRPNAFLQGFSRRGPRTVEHLLSVLEMARDGWISELLTHPGCDGDWRGEELDVLLDPRVRDWLNGPDVELVSFGAL
jgi:predicted glycoside hydrolase/deacetylase ChbG (UPF0249 family)